MVNSQDFKEVEQVLLESLKRVSQRYLDNVSKNLDELRQLVREHPWDALGTAFSLGFAFGVPKYRKTFALAVWGLLKTQGTVEPASGGKKNENVVQHS